MAENSMDDTKREWVRSWLIKAHDQVNLAIDHAQAVYDFVCVLIPPEAKPG
jgi:hypothetical protein